MNVFIVADVGFITMGLNSTEIVEVRGIVGLGTHDADFK